MLTRHEIISAEVCHEISRLRLLRTIDTHTNEVSAHGIESLNIVVNIWLIMNCFYEPDRATMRPRCVSACIEFVAKHATYMER